MVYVGYLWKLVTIWVYAIKAIECHTSICLYMQNLSLQPWLLFLHSPSYRTYTFVLMLFCWVQNQHMEWLFLKERDIFTCTNCYLWLWLLWMTRPQYRKNTTKSEAISVKASMSPDHPFSPSAIPQLTASRSLRQQLQEVKIIQVSISLLGLGILKKGWNCRCYVCILMKITPMIFLILN